MSERDQSAEERVIWPYVVIIVIVFCGMMYVVSRDKQLQSYPVPADGMCMFTAFALSDALESGMDESRARRYAMHTRGHYQDLARKQTRRDPELRTLRATIGHDPAGWGDEIDLQALGQVRDYEIHVHDAKTKDTNIVGKLGRHPMHIIYDREAKHYSAAREEW